MQKHFRRPCGGVGVNSLLNLLLFRRGEEAQDRFRLHVVLAQLNLAVSFVRAAVWWLHLLRDVLGCATSCVRLGKVASTFCS